MPPQTLDPQASCELEEERRLHVSTVTRIRSGNAQALLREVDRHFDRVNEIMQAFVCRAARGPPAGGGTP